MLDIAIDPSVLEERNESYTSLTDMNGIPVFMNAYEEQVKNYQQVQQSIYKELQRKIFIEPLAHEQDTTLTVKKMMFSNTTDPVVKATEKNEESQLAMAVPVLGLLTVFVIILLLRYIEKRRRKWKDNEIDAYLYE